ncbi:hypothetical protein L9F63_010110, partial [Diploptera punctata]
LPHMLKSHTVNAFVIPGHLVINNGHLLYVQKTLKCPPVVLILVWILLVYVQNLRLFRLTCPLLKRRHFTRFNCLKNSGEAKR